MERVLAALRHQVRVRNHGAEHRVVLRCLNLEFGDGVGIGDRARGVRAVDGVAAGRGVPVDVHARCAAPERAGVVDARYRTRGHREHLREVPRIERHRGNRLLIDQGAGGGRGGSQVTRALHRRRCRIAGFEHRVEDGNLGGVQRQPRHSRGPEAFTREFDLVCSRRQQREAKCPSRVSSGRVVFVRSRVQQSDRHIRQAVTGRVGDRAFQGAGGGGLSVGQPRGGAKRMRAVNRLRRTHVCQLRDETGF